MKVFGACILASLALAAACFLWFSRRESPPPVELPTPATRAMASRLEAARREWEAAPMEPQGDRLFPANRPLHIPVLRKRLEGNQDFREVVMLRHKLALELLRDGRTREAMDEFERVYQMVSRSSTEETVKRQVAGSLRSDAAISLLRLAEEENCIALHNPESCILPIRRGGVHVKTDGSRRAIDVLTQSLTVDAADLGARWLLNLAYMTLGEYPDGVPTAWRIPPAVFASDRDVPRFPNVASRLGVDAVGLAGGCAVEDFDGDGRLDIVVSSWGLSDQLRYFRQRPDGAFEDRTGEAGLVGEVGGLNICHADFDNDGAPDVFVLRGGWLEDAGRHPNSLLRNLGGGRFDDVTERAGLLSFKPTQTAAWGDFDNDGWLDLFVGCEQNEGRREHASELFHNNGDGTFTDCAAASGLAHLGFVKGAAWGDYDGDGFPDLYVSRVGQPNSLFRNSGRTAPESADSREFSWSFVDVTERAGVAEPRFSFPTWFFDYDNDGWLDLFVAGFDGATIDKVAADYLGEPQRRGHPRLYRNRGDGTFEDVTRRTRLDRVLLVMGAGFGDLDGDGFLDMYLGTGAPDLGTLLPNRMFLNDAGKVFQDVTSAGGFGHLQKGHGVAFADFDEDGDQDVYAVMGGWFTGDRFRNAFFENPGHAGHWLTLKLEGRRSNRSAIGARVRVTVRTAAGRRELHRVVGTGGSFGSTTLREEIGLGNCLAVDEVEVRWPTSGVVQTLTDVAPDQVIEIVEEVR